MSAAAAWEPAFPGQRPPFEPGNQLGFTAGHELSLKHGAYSPAKVNPLALALVEAVLADERTTYLSEFRFRHALWRWAEAEARYELLSEYVNGMTIEQATASKAGSTPILEQLRRWDEQAARHRGRLGLDPVSASRLEQVFVNTEATVRLAGLDEVRARGAALVAAQTQRQETTDVADSE